MVVYTSHRRGLSASGLFAVSILIAGGATAVVLYPTLTGALGPSGARSQNSTTLFTSISTTSVVVFPATTVTTTISNAWTQGQVANATLGSPQVQEYIHNAYNYTFGVPTQTGSNPILVSTMIGVVGAQKASGNWTTGYNITLSGIRKLNVTVQMVRPSYFQVIGMRVQNYSDWHGGIIFAADQKSAIADALANSTVKSYVSSHPTFVDGAFLFPSGNTTYGGDYLVTFFPINGTQILNVFVNPSSGAVVTTYVNSRVYHFCYSPGFCFNDPWVVNGTG
jgi:hypothetical protein